LRVFESGRRQQEYTNGPDGLLFVFGSADVYVYVLRVYVVGGNQDARQLSRRRRRAGEA